MRDFVLQRAMSLRESLENQANPPPHENPIQKTDLHHMQAAFQLLLEAPGAAIRLAIREDHQKDGPLAVAVARHAAQHLREGRRALSRLLEGGQQPGIRGALHALAADGPAKEGGVEGPPMRPRFKKKRSTPVLATEKNTVSLEAPCMDEFIGITHHVLLVDLVESFICHISRIRIFDIQIERPVTQHTTIPYQLKGSDDSDSYASFNSYGCIV